VNLGSLVQGLTKGATCPKAVGTIREFVLDAALRGLLTGQIPADGTADELVSALPRPVQNVGVDDLYPIPSSWRWVMLADVADFSTGRTPSRNDLSFWNTGDHPWVSIADMTNGQSLTRTKETVSNRAAREVFRCEPRPVGTMLMSFKLTIGKIARLGIPAYHNEAIISIEPLLPEIDSFLFLALPHLALHGRTKSAIKGATLNRSSLSKIPIPLPPVAEQARIVAKVDEFNALCDELETVQIDRDATRDRFRAASLARLTAPTETPGEVAQKDVTFFLSHSDRMVTKPEDVRDLRRTVLDLAIRGRLTTREPDDGNAAHALELLAQRRAEKVRRKQVPKPYPVPAITEETGLFPLRSGWAWCHLGDLCYRVADGPHFSPQYVPNTDGVPFLSTRNVRLDGFDLSNLKYVSASDHAVFCQRIRPTRGDILYTKGGTTGIARVNDLEFEFSVWVHLAVLRTDQELVNPYYVALALNSQWCYAQSQAYTQGISNFDLGLTRMIKITLPLPPSQEQARVVARVDDLMAVCNELEHALRSAEEGRAKLLEAVLHEALNGRVADAELAEATA
jgi:type I restriction enzyme, S subunit